VAQALAQRDGERLRAGVFCLLVLWLQRLLLWRRRRRVRLVVHKFSMPVLLLLLMLARMVLPRLPVSVSVPLAVAMMQASRRGHWPRRLRAVEWPRSVRERRERRQRRSAWRRVGPSQPQCSTVVLRCRPCAGRSREPCRRLAGNNGRRQWVVRRGAAVTRGRRGWSCLLVLLLRR
jgi:hypothetical protein